MRTFMHMGFHGVGIVTALTAQNTKRISDIFIPPSSFLWEQYQALRDDMRVSGIKMGMLGSRKNIPVIVQILSENPDLPLVMDPIVRSSSGYRFLESVDLSVYTESIGPKASLITPNIPEAELLSGMQIRDISGMKRAAEKISQTIKAPCLLKGGHIKGSPTDVLYDGKKHALFANEKIEKDVHGTGCFLSSRILGYLVRGRSLQNACRLGIKDTAEAIQMAEPIGHGQHIIQFHQ